MDSSPPVSAPFSALVLAGGRGSRLGGRDKGALAGEDGRTLLQRALAAVAGAHSVVVVGEPDPAALPPGTLVAREDPPLGGPAAATLAGLDRLEAPDAAGWVLVLAVDMPHVGAGTVARLLEAAATSGTDGARLLDPDGRHPLALVVDGRRLAAVRPDAGDPRASDGLPLRRLLAPLDLTAVPTAGAEHHDVDTPDDLAAWRADG
ncbi:molybdenum cofactor guanylyltransferase [Nocardioides bruguierae]|uniref:molybdenum cofactor guanylyltransferase n=1 Tax=Nocardioides bruguierae TaxID=2945102 RepID=UPI0020226F09|nr:NTP transferase domain-containing protein [Nocardioides bruguierae]MCL8025292.1 NTP transferase domain-containing protein [Nocardioides bruguierae]